MSNNNELDKDSYKALFEYQTKQLDLIKARYAGLENKASKYLTFISLIIAALSIFSKQYLFDNSSKGGLYCFIVVLIVLTFFSLCSIARFLFQALRVESVAKLDTGIETVKLFVEHEISHVYYNLSKKIVEVIDLYEAGCLIKVDYLKRAFSEIKFCGIMFILTVILIIIDSI
ncbi:hypothetical protein GCM10025882_31990 [Acinetobacter gyllenbergii]|uniref:SMODS and SLOG-associating 2TM effector domain-containing protein n=1 Tax=Acinetobacter gyllenbergii CIP 110306 = MTCC 11365 TaxID=1217657 RepID=A0A829HBQ9_9GAMM|nr:hypothetical protein [Acinetobacter gyllenbergii]EPF72573.1 hypothetical protein F957_03709 [Acinetobacter gyllenbergii CIP 110306 = MTCC 11365]GMA12774.1 hypothetical protein GCM10025882_31990 [Acinetobacter gyllenbergii]